MANKFAISEQIVMLRGDGVNDFYNATKDLLVAGYAPYTPLFAPTIDFAVCQQFILGETTHEYVLIVSEGLEQHAKRMAEMIYEGWDFVFVSEQFEGKYLQWVSRSLSGWGNASRIPYPVELTKEAPQTFAGLFIKHTQRLSVNIPVRLVVGGVVL